MGTCLICGTSVDGYVCGSHEQDVFFEFRGNHSNQLTPDRYYRGEVDGVADFGVFVNLSDRVTGLLHQSELPKRLESYDWTAGDELFVLVKEIRDNGDVDLGWSIRQDDREFRGHLIHTPEGDELPAERAATTAESESEPVPESEPEPEPESTSRSPAPEPEEPEPEPESVDAEEPVGADERGSETETSAPEDLEALRSRSEPDRVGLGTLTDHVGERVRIEGTVASIRQTGGPTVFRVRDETGAADCAAFEAPGVRAYAEVEEGDAVRVQGVVERHNDSMQVETDALTVLSADDAQAVEDRMTSALEDRARPEMVTLLAEYGPVASLDASVGEAATTIRRAIFEARPVVIRHAATADGYLAGAAIERAVLSLVRAEHDQRDAIYHLVDRRPFEGPDYDMNDATRDVTDMLDRRERHGEKIPLFLFVGAGGTAASADGLGLLAMYEADRVIIDAEPADEEARTAVNTVVTPTEAPTEPLATTAIAAAVGATVDTTTSDDLRHLPATAYWRDAPAAYIDLAAEAGYEPADLALVRKAVALEAYYQAFEDKRELISDLLFGDPALAEPASEQFADRVADEVETAEAHLEERTVGERTVAVLDVAAFTHRYDFPPTPLLLDQLFERVSANALIGIGEDDLRVRADPPVDVRAVADRVREVVAEAGIGAEGGRSGRITFLVGERDVVVDAAIGAVANLAVA